MDKKTFIAECLSRATETRKARYSPTSDQLVAGTKIGGQPWWPTGTPRPRCDADHFMNFIAQFQLCEVPGFSPEDRDLLSFHYCMSCAYEGNMPWGWPYDRDRGYDLRFLETGESEHDGLGLVAPDLIGPQALEFEDILEVPQLDDGPDSLVLKAPKDFFDYQPPDYDEYSPLPSDQIYPDLKHVSSTKLGGHPTWEQNPDWPHASSGSRLNFVTQLDLLLCSELAWATGIALIFAEANRSTKRESELVIQTS